MSHANRVSLLVVWCGALLSCGGAQNTGTSTAIKLSKEECQSKALAIVASAPTCLVAESKLDELAKGAPECVAILGGGRLWDSHCEEVPK